MDPINNPFAPGAGTKPPDLAGRDKILEDARIALGRVRQGRPARSQLLLGLRGVGKTVLLNELAEMAISTGFEAIVLEAPEDRHLAQMLVPPLRRLLYQLSLAGRSKAVAKRGLGILRSFASAFKASVGDVEFGVQPIAGVADSGDLGADLPEMLVATTSAAKAADKPIALFIDEVQYLSVTDLSALITAVHRSGQKSLPFVMFGAGLPQLAALAGEAKSYAERLFVYPDVGALNEEDAKEALRSPLHREQVEITDEALDLIVDRTRGYPYFLQEWGSHVWNLAEGSPITLSDTKRSSIETLQSLDSGFFRVRLDRLTPREKDYMRAMAALGPGPHRSGEIAQQMRMAVSKAGPLRNGLIKKGMIYSPQHGDTAFTVPMFDEFMLRSIPSWEPGKPSSGDPGPKKPTKRR